MLTETEPLSNYATSQTLSLSSAETERLEFLEGPACELITKSIADMTDEELSVMLAEIKQLTMVPGGMNRALDIEAGTVALGKTKPRRTKKATSIEDLC